MMSLDRIFKRVCSRRTWFRGNWFRGTWFRCAFVACAILSVPDGAAAQAADDPPVPAPGMYNMVLPRGGEPSVRYAISIPRGYSPSTPVPLILALHFGVRDGESTGAGRALMQSLMAPALSELGAVIVAPDSVRGNWSTPDNEQAVTALLDWVTSRYVIDKRKVAVTGYSMGGAGSWHFAEKFPERFSAAIPVSGRPPASAAGWRLPVLAIHSQDDQVVPFEPAEARIEELQKAGVNATLIPLTGVTHYETSRFREALRQSVPWLREIWKE
jgi:dipeptidyl aminopeptidase/acylaminoacyl peptidase